MKTNKIRSFVPAIVLAVSFTFSSAFSQETNADLQFGARAGGGIIIPMGEDADGIDNGFGVGAGMFLEYQMGSVILHPEIFFAYRKPFSISEGEIEVKATEFALEIPVLLKIPVSKVYFEVGPQLAFIFNSELEASYQGVTISLPSDDARKKFEFGITAGLGFNITEKLSLDARYNYILTSIDATDASLSQIQIGLNFLF